jgi:hypothetical protein
LLGELLADAKDLRDHARPLTREPLSAGSDVLHRLVGESYASGEPAKTVFNPGALQCALKDAWKLGASSRFDFHSVCLSCGGSPGIAPRRSPGGLAKMPPTRAQRSLAFDSPIIRTRYPKGDPKRQFRKSALRGAA